MTKLTRDTLTVAIDTSLKSLNSQSTRINYKRWMIFFAGILDQADYPPITYDLIIGYMAMLEELYKPANRILALSATKKLCETIHRQDRELIDLYTNTIIQGIKPEKYKAALTGQMIPYEDTEKLIAVCRQDDKDRGVRDAAIIAMLHSTGMRRAECAGLMLEDYHPPEGMITLKQTKNKEDRLAYLNLGALSHLQTWLDLRGLDPGPLFWRTKKGGYLCLNRGLSGAAVYNMIRLRCKEAEIEKYTPHDFRRTLISNLLDKVDIALVSKIVGHSSVAMTATYDRRSDEEMKRAIQQIETPF